MESNPVLWLGFLLLQTDGLTATTTVSSPLNLGMNLSPRLRSAPFSGLKRHITFTPHTPHSTASTITAAVRKHWDKESTPSPSDRNQISRVSVRSGCCWLTVWTLPPHTGPPWTTEPHGTLGHGVLSLSMHRIELDRYWFYWLVYQ